MRDVIQDDMDGTPHGSPQGPPRGSPVQEREYDPSPGSRYHHSHASPPHSAPQNLRIKTDAEESHMGMHVSDRLVVSTDETHSFPTVHVPSLPPSQEFAHVAPMDDGIRYEDERHQRREEEVDERNRPTLSNQNVDARQPTASSGTRATQENNGRNDERKHGPRRISVENLGPVKDEDKGEEEKKEDEDPRGGKADKKKKDDRMAIMAALAMTALGGKDEEGENNEDGKSTSEAPDAEEEKTREVSDDARSTPSLPPSPDLKKVAEKKRKRPTNQSETVSFKRPREVKVTESSPTSSTSSPEDDELSTVGTSERRAGVDESHVNVVSCSSTLSSSPSVGSTQYHRSDGRNPSPLSMMPKQVRYENPRMQQGPYGHPTHSHMHYSAGRGPSYHLEGAGHYEGPHHRHHSYHHAPHHPRQTYERNQGPPLPRGIVNNENGRIIHAHPPPPHHLTGGTVSPSSANMTQDTPPVSGGSPVSSSSSKCEPADHHPALPYPLSFRKICSRCGKARSEHGELGFGNKCVFQDCGKCGAGIQMHERAGIRMGFFCTLAVEDGATPGAAEAYERNIRELAVRAEMKQSAQERDHAQIATVAV